MRVQESESTFVQTCGHGMCASRWEQLCVCARAWEHTDVNVCVCTCGHGCVLVQAGRDMLDCVSMCV